MATYRIKEVSENKDFIFGKMPNIQMPTMGGHFFWTNRKEDKGYRLQFNNVTGHARILDSCDERIAWGTQEAMVRTFLILTCNDELVAGDVIGVKRILIEHYAVYIGNDEVIHYDSDPHGKLCIHKASMNDFLKGNKSFFMLDFPDKYGKPTKIPMSRAALLAFPTGNYIQDRFNMVKIENYHLYSPEETVQRAKSRLSESEYNLVTNNCEHFAIWCKTGISESHQVNEILKRINSWTIF